MASYVLDNFKEKGNGAKTEAATVELKCAMGSFRREDAIEDGNKENKRRAAREAGTAWVVLTRVRARERGRPPL